MTPEEQVDLWVKGKSVHNRERDECCPDFSCCKPYLLATKSVESKPLRWSKTTTGGGWLWSRDYVIGLSCFEPRGVFYAFPSIKRTGMTSVEFVERLFTEEKVAAVPSSAFGQYGEGMSVAAMPLR